MIIPFQPRELSARIRSLIRRVSWARHKQICVFENVIVDFVRMNATRGGEEVPLTAKEFKILEFMTKHATGSFPDMTFFMKYGATRTIRVLEPSTTTSSDCASSRDIVSVVFSVIHGANLSPTPCNEEIRYEAFHVCLCPILCF